MWELLSSARPGKEAKDKMNSQTQKLVLSQARVDHKEFALKF